MEILFHITQSHVAGFVVLGCSKVHNVYRLKRGVGISTKKNEILSVTIKHDGLDETSSFREPYKPLIISTGGKVKIYVVFYIFTY